MQALSANKQIQLERNKVILQKYIPSFAIDIIIAWIFELDFKLKIKKERTTKLGDYTPPHNGLNHTITINCNLNQYQFFVTLIHEIAHLKTYIKFKNSVAPHGIEWKQEFKLLMNPFLSSVNLPLDVLYAIRQYIQNPSASSCSDLTLARTLQLYDIKTQNEISVEYLPIGSQFEYQNKRIFKIIEKVKKRIKCQEVATGRFYLFSPIAVVKMIE